MTALITSGCVPSQAFHVAFGAAIRDYSTGSLSLNTIMRISLGDLRQWRDRHFAGALSPSLPTHPLVGGGGCSRLRISSTAQATSTTTSSGRSVHGLQLQSLWVIPTAAVS